jgi:hypothetical protein
VAWLAQACGVPLQAVVDQEQPYSPLHAACVAFPAQGLIVPVQAPVDDQEQR